MNKYTYTYRFCKKIHQHNVHGLRMTFGRLQNSIQRFGLFCNSEQGVNTKLTGNIIINKNYDSYDFGSTIRQLTNGSCYFHSFAEKEILIVGIIQTVRLQFKFDFLICVSNRSK